MSIQIRNDDQVALLSPDFVLNTGDLHVAPRTSAVSYSSGGETLILATGGAGGITVTLPSARANGKTYMIKKVDAGAGAVTVARNGADTIESETSVILAHQFDYIVIVADGVSNWQQVAGSILINATLHFLNDATVFEDLRVPLETGKTAGANVPTFEKVKDNGAGSTGVYAYNFDDGDEIWFSVQIPHSWKEGTTIYPHLHWCSETDATGSNIGIGLEYTWADINDTFGNTTIITRDVAGDTAYKHLLSDFAIAGITDATKNISSVFLCRFFRQAAQSNNYAGGIFALDIDFHYEIDTVGSRTVSAK